MVGWAGVEMVLFSHETILGDTSGSAMVAHDHQSAAICLHGCELFRYY